MASYRTTLVPRLQLLFLSLALLTLSGLCVVVRAQDSTAVSNYIAATTFVNTTTGVQPLTTGDADVPNYTDDAVQAFVDGNAAFAFTANVSAQHKQDIIAAMLFAQLASNAKVNKTQAPFTWFTQYISVLENIGYATISFAFNDQSLSGTTFQVEKQILSVMQAILASYPAELALVSALLDGLNSDSSGPIKIFSRESESANAATFQVQTVSENDGIMQAHFTGWALSVSKTVVNFLWFQFSTSGSSLQQGSEGFVQSDMIWDSIPPGRNITIRQQIYNKVGIYVASYIDEVDF